MHAFAALRRQIFVSANASAGSRHDERKKNGPGEP
jgi:hypothetical protein